MTTSGSQNPETAAMWGLRTWAMTPPNRPDVTHDAVILLPGIMGSVLVDAETGKQLWGLSGRALARAWVGGESLERLVVTADERRGRTDRVTATEVLTLPAAAPVLRGIEPYDLLRDAIKGVTLPGAVKDFPYDWRLSVEHNAGLLAAAARSHLDGWRRVVAGDPRLSDEPPPRLVFVAHSMGGLIAAAALHADPRLADDTRAVVTLGTPFHGSVLAVAMLKGDHKVSGLPQARLRALAVSAPGMYDLLPIYRCLDMGTDVLPLDFRHIASLGGDADLAREALATRRGMRESARPIPGHRPAIGIFHPTPTSLSLDGGVLTLHTHGHRTGTDGLLVRDLATGIPEPVNREGDGTVYRDAAFPHHSAPAAYVPARHGALTRHKAALSHVAAVLTEHDEHMGPPASRGATGITLPDQAQVGQPWTLDIHTTRSPTTLRASITPVDGGDTTELRLSRGDGPDRGSLLRAPHTVTSPGLFRVTVDTGSGPGTELTELLLVVEAS